MKTLRPLLFGSLIALALAAPLARAADEAPNPWKFEFHGFVTGSVYTQDQVFAGGQGQGLLYAAPTPANQALPPAGTNTLTSPKETDRIYSGDIRNSRFAFAMSGPKVFDGAAQPRGYLEFDLFGGFNSGAYGTDQPLPRIRVAIAEIKFGNSVLQFGQQNQLVVTQIPTSISHIANPVTYGAGTIGWRTPGVRYAYTFELGEKPADKLELAVEATKNLWSNNALAAGIGAAAAPNSIGQGEASGMPMIQARAKYDGKGGDFAYMGYGVVVYDQVDLNGFGATITPPAAAGTKTSLSPFTWELGGKLTWNNMVTVAANYYQGKGTANMLGSQLAFGDIKDTGYWVSLAGNFTKELSLMVVYGANTPDKADMRLWNGNATRLATTTMGGMFKYQDGGYALGLEFYQLQSDYSTGAATQVQTKGTQGLLTGAYFF